MKDTVYFTRANFRGADLSGANLKGFVAWKSDFTNADLTNTNIEEAASYVWIIAQYPLANDEAPLFHPPSTV